MLVFLDFEASSLSDDIYPIEIAWVFEDGRSEAHLIRPAPTWTDWDTASEAIHHIPRARLLEEGTPHDVVARRMLETLNGHDLLASAPSWDGKWLSYLLRSAGIPRHALRLRRSGLARREAAEAILTTILPPGEARGLSEALASEAEAAAATRPPEHRALADAQGEHALWRSVQEAARRAVAGVSAAPE